MSEQLGVALIGAGNSGGHYHLPHLLNHPGFRLRTVATRSGTVGPELPDAVTVVSDWRSAISDPSIDLVVVALPHDLHHPVALAALDAGRHVLVEKPITVTGDEARELEAAANRSGVVLAAHHQRRFEADFVALTEVVRSGELGEIWRIVVTRSHQGRYRESTPTRPHVGSASLGWAHARASGGGIARVIAPHSVDQLLTLADDGVDRVSGRAHLDPVDDVEDWVAIDIDFASGITGTVEAFRRSRIAPARFTVYGSAGTAVATDGTELRITTDDGDRVIDGLEPPGTMGREIYDDLFAAVTRGAPLRASLADAIRVVDVIEAAETSFRGANSWVSASSGGGSH
ncbi:Gfo/Idh/MocA family protein [Amnibacterium flavum]|uniref:Gfo/Idh/MocA family oxidoreductase n=1 Tax=Amnibacterium flavum TaxID=2173173 RepID=A0A2V1HQ77_9MICO|nr:Gfo/Idh/MocA family oxidoreductase [Amnibacterium flavum]PVZ94491.1 hypothetical protein DDQ50_12365 [Amnibacterium flavum]